MNNAKGIVFKFGDNVDTDVIIPARYLNSSDPAELATHCMEDIDKDFIKNVKKGDIIVAEKNFGCGSSREHAPWALLQYGFRCVIAPSFADIFYSNSLKNGLVPVVLSEDVIDRLFRDCEKTEGYRLTVDLDKQTVTEPDGTVTPFEISAFRRWAIMNGFDDIGITLSTRQDKIRAFEDKRLAEKPWLAKMLNQ